jgi:hypothetical protein
MKLIDIESKATLEDFITLKKTELVQFLQKYNEKISGNKISFLKDTSLHLCD